MALRGLGVEAMCKQLTGHLDSVAVPSLLVARLVLIQSVRGPLYLNCFPQLYFNIASPWLEFTETRVKLVPKY